MPSRGRLNLHLQQNFWTLVEEVPFFDYVRNSFFFSLATTIVTGCQFYGGFRVCAYSVPRQRGHIGGSSVVDGLAGNRHYRAVVSHLSRFAPPGYDQWANLSAQQRTNSFHGMGIGGIHQASAI